MEDRTVRRDACIGFMGSDSPGTEDPESSGGWFALGAGVVGPEETQRVLQLGQDRCALERDAERQGPWGWEGGRASTASHMRGQGWASQPPGPVGSPPPPGEPPLWVPQEDPADPGHHRQETRRGHGAWLTGQEPV